MVESSGGIRVPKTGSSMHRADRTPAGRFSGEHSATGRFDPRRAMRRVYSPETP